MRLAKRNAWRLIAAGQQSIGLFEDDIVPRRSLPLVRARLAAALADHDARRGDLTFLEDGATSWWRGAAVWHSPRAPAHALLDLTSGCNKRRAQGVDRHHEAVCSTMECKRVNGLFVQNRSIHPYLHNRKNQHIGHRVGRWSSTTTYALDEEGVLRPTDSTNAQ